ncbi:MAG TPA: hypothetical protein VKA73_13070 [Rubrobacter sp.]|nr:hypothetical protein [Rubrobacter sp.]
MAQQQATPRVHTRDGGARDETLKGTETKAAFKTTELIFYLLAVAGVLIASLAVSGTEGTDPFGANDAWRYVTYLTIGYLLSRGLAKSGSRNPREEGE